MIVLCIKKLVYLYTLETKPLGAVCTKACRHCIISTGGTGKTLFSCTVGPSVPTALSLTHKHIVHHTVLRETLLAHRTMDEGVHCNKADRTVDEFIILSVDNVSSFSR